MISLVIVTHNQALELHQNLPMLMQQEGVDYEVIVVDEGSTDETSSVLERVGLQYPTRLRRMAVPDTALCISRSKLALSIGIREAKGEWIAVTRPDCQPASNLWLQRLYEAGREKEIVIGYAEYTRGNSVFSRRIRLDRFFHRYFALQQAMKGRTYRGEACNMMFRRDLFLEGKGFAGYVNLQGGEYDLFVNHHATNNNVAVCLAPEAWVFQSIPHSSRTWHNDKLFYVETRKHYLRKPGYGFEGLLTLSVILHFGGLLLILGLALQQLWLALGVTAAIWMAIRLVRAYWFGKRAKAYGMSTCYLSLPYQELRVVVSDLSFWLRHKITPKRIFLKK